MEFHYYMYGVSDVIAHQLSVYIWGGSIWACVKLWSFLIVYGVCPRTDRVFRLHRIAPCGMLVPRGVDANELKFVADDIRFSGR